jgi:phosphoenolpyruvate---glycerone phosphotransferase subunit DhaL
VTGSCDGPGVVAAIRAVAAAVATERVELTRLDRDIGDGDHGENLNRGFQAVLAKLDAAQVSDVAQADGATELAPGAVLRLVATTLISTVGGAAGPLYGTAFLRAATSAGDAGVLDAAAVTAALAAAQDGVAARGHAEPGDKTMLDALGPAVAAAQQAAGPGSVADVLSAAADAAAGGAKATVPLVARKGRASYLGERSAGHPDPGATSTAVILRALAEAAGG